MAFLFLLHFWNLWNKMSTAHKKKKNMFGSTFFCPNVWHHVGDLLRVMLHVSQLPHVAKYNMYN